MNRTQAGVCSEGSEDPESNDSLRPELASTPSRHFHTVVTSRRLRGWTSAERTFRQQLLRFTDETSAVNTDLTCSLVSCDSSLLHKHHGSQCLDRAAPGHVLSFPTSGTISFIWSLVSLDQEKLLNPPGLEVPQSELDFLLKDAVWFSLELSSDTVIRTSGSTTGERLLSHKASERK